MIGRESHVDVSGLDFDQLCCICNANNTLETFGNFFQSEIAEMPSFLEQTVRHS